MSEQRFEVGQKHPFIFVRFQFSNGRSNNNGLIPRTYLPWEHKLLRIDIFELESMEEHQSPVEYSEDGATAPGYVLRDQNGKVWHNQYPQAHFGQISDKANWIAHRHFESRDEIRTAVDEGGHILSGVCLKNYVTDVAFGIHELRELKRLDLADQLQKHLDAVCEQFRTQFGMDIGFEPQQPGEHLLEHYSKVKISPLQGALA